MNRFGDLYELFKVSDVSDDLSDDWPLNEIEGLSPSLTRLASKEDRRISVDRAFHQLQRAIDGRHLSQRAAYAAHARSGSPTQPDPESATGSQ
jgi:hypothetical protein